MQSQALLEEPDFAPCAVLGYCHAIHVADPDHSSWADVPSEAHSVVVSTLQKTKVSKLNFFLHIGVGNLWSQGFFDPNSVIKIPRMLHRDP